MRHISAAISVIFGILGLIYYVVIMGWGMSITKWTNDQLTTGSSPEAAEEIAPLKPMPRDPFTWARDWRESGAKFAQDELNDRRVVRYQEHLPASVFFARGEELPEKDRIDVYASARLPLHAMERCVEVLELIGTRCVVTGGEARLADDEIGPDAGFRVSYSLAYQPAYDVTTDEVARSNDTTWARISFGGRHEEDPTPNTAAERLRVMKAAIDVCAYIRRIYGSCIVSSVSFVPTEARIRPEDQDEWIRVDALRSDVRFETLGRSSMDGRDRFERHVRAATAAVWAGPFK